MFNTVSNPCVMIDVLAGMRVPTTVDKLVGVEVVIIEVWTNVMVDSLVDVVMSVIDAYTDILLEVCVSDVEIIVVSAAVIALEFAVPVSCAGDVLGVILVGVLVNALADVLTGVIICLVFGIVVDSFCGVNVNVLKAVITVDIGMPTPLEKLLLLC